MTLTRRSAVARLGAGAAVLPARTALGTQANSAVAVGIIGVGRRGRYVGSIFAKEPAVRIAAICDIYDDQIAAAQKDIPAASQARVYKACADLLADSAIDAVLIATPPFLHPEHFEAAVAARKHVYCEKPAAADVAGVKRVLRAGAAADRSKHTVFGLQRRYSRQYQAAAEILSSGKLGQLLLMKSNWVSWGVLRPPFKPNPAWSEEERRIRYWPHFRDTSGDFIVEQDCHGVDVLNWFCGSHPLKAVATGGSGARVYGDNSDQVFVAYTYPRGLTGWLVGTQLCQKRFSDVKEQFVGTEGTLETHLYYYRWHRGPADIVERRVTHDVTEDAVRDFVAKVASGQPGNTVPWASECTFTALLGRMAAELGREVTWEEMLATA